MGPDTGRFVAEILNTGWLVRHYTLKRTRHDRLRRAQAIQKLGLVVRQALSSSDDFEALLGAVVDALRPRDNSPF